MLGQNFGLYRSQVYYQNKMKIDVRTLVKWPLIIILCIFTCHASSFTGKRKDTRDTSGITKNIGRVVDVTPEFNRNENTYRQKFSAANIAGDFAQSTEVTEVDYEGTRIRSFSIQERPVQGLTRQNEGTHGTFNSFSGGHGWQQVPVPSHGGPSSPRGGPSPPHRGPPPPHRGPPPPRGGSPHRGNSPSFHQERPPTHGTNSFGQSRPAAHHPSSQIYSDNDNRATEISSQWPTNYNTNIEESITRPKPSYTENHNGNIRQPSSGLQSHTSKDRNGQAGRRPPGQSGYPGNDALSSTVDSFNGGGRPFGQNTENFNSQGDVNDYGGQNSYNFHGNDDNLPTKRPTGTMATGDRKPMGNNDYSGGNGRRPTTSSSESGVDGLRKPSGGESSWVSGRPLTGTATRYTTTMRTTTRNYYDLPTSTARPTPRTTTRPKKTASIDGCQLPQQPKDGHYELGGCDLPCNKEPGDLVPNTSVLTYTCDDGFVHNGSAVSVCLNDTWYMPPSCLKTCSPLNSISVDIICKHHGNIVPCDEPMEPGTRATLACKPSYKIPLTEDPVYREITCMENGIWNRRLFRCLPKCGTTIAHGNTLVVNGFTAKVGVFPWHAGIYEKKKSRHVYEQICAGTLINSNLVVSAAHCFYDEATNQVKDSSTYYVAAGKHYRSWDTKETYAQKSKIKTITVPDRYIGAGGNFAQDIALLELETPFELTDLVRPVCLDWDNVLERKHLQVGNYGKAVGWGKTASGQPSEELQEINVPFVSFDQCLSDVPSDFRGYITPDKFCAGYLNGSSLCEGDSGGGLCFESNGLWYLRGIVSVSPVRDFSCDYNSYTGFTYFSHFREWVRKIFLKS